jgi:signal transduction histidine kinase
MNREVSLVDLIVHELRTPLTVALGSLRQVDLADPTAEAALGRARRSCERLEQIAADMREFVRVSSFEPSDATAVDLHAVIGRAVAVVTSLRDVRIEMRGDASARVLAFPQRLEGALSALLLALARAAGPNEPLSVTVIAAADRVLVNGQRADASPESATGFDAEWVGGVGFALPLARAAIERAGGQVCSADASDGRFGAFSVSLVQAPQAPPR